jgi:hypothetical protein
MNARFNKWLGASQPWWRFWDPRSGLIGGFIAGSLLMAVQWLFFWWLLAVTA